MLRTHLAGLLLAAVPLVGCTTTDEGTRHASAPPVGAPVQVDVADPAEIDIPKIGAHSTLVPLGLNTDPKAGPIGAMQTPDVHTPKQAGYYARSHPQAGQPGLPLVVVAHVNGDGQPGLFAHLKDLKPGDAAQVKLKDATLLTFQVTSVESGPKTAFPAQKVFGRTDDRARLVMVTCGGQFNPKARSYLNNLIAYADLALP